MGAKTKHYVSRSRVSEVVESVFVDVPALCERCLFIEDGACKLLTNTPTDKTKTSPKYLQHDDSGSRGFMSASETATNRQFEHHVLAAERHRHRLRLVACPQLHTTIQF